MGNAGSDGKSSSPPVTQAASTVRAPVDDADMESKLEKDALKASKDFQDALWGKGLFNMDDPDQDLNMNLGGRWPQGGQERAWQRRTNPSANF